MLRTALGLLGTPGGHTLISVEAADGTRVGWSVPLRPVS
jgi:hypothetical protein